MLHHMDTYGFFIYSRTRKTSSKFNDLKVIEEKFNIEGFRKLDI